MRRRREQSGWRRALALIVGLGILLFRRKLFGRVGLRGYSEPWTWRNIVRYYALRRMSIFSPWGIALRVGMRLLRINIR